MQPSPLNRSPVALGRAAGVPAVSSPTYRHPGAAGSALSDSYASRVPAPAAPDPSIRRQGAAAAASKSW